MQSTTPKVPQQKKKSTEATVFVRFVPATSEIRRHHLEDAFSQIGPIKKSAVIHNEDKSSSYAFVKYTKQQDAEQAAKTLNDHTIMVGSTAVLIRVALASEDRHERKKTNHAAEVEGEVQPNDYKKKHCRVILRNLSFYAKESHIRSALSQFGTIHDIHLPMVQKQHRGFGFVTFDKKADAAKCVAAHSIEVAKRAVEIAWSLSKQTYEENKSQNIKKGTAKQKSEDIDEAMNQPEEKDGDDKDKNDEEASDSNKEEASDSDDNDDDDDDDSSSDEENDGSAKDVDEDEEKSVTSTTMDEENEKEKRKKEISEKRSLFVRNLPFDATRHDLFECFRRFGRVSSIYLVKEKGVFKGTAFVVFETAAGAQRALEGAGMDSTFVAMKSNEIGSSGLTLKGRPLRVNLTVDKDSAHTFDHHQSLRADRRHLYLQAVGRVEDDWEHLPETDQLKRQAAWTEKQSKLRSPLFFINPTRLSIRNLAKHVDEADLKALVAQATLKGMGRVTVEDAVAHWKATGDKTARDIMSLLEQPKENILIPFDPKNIKKYIPSVFINRDFMVSKDKTDPKPPSRGFGFVEFQHHIHALACLRELNNNTLYSAEYVAGGKQASLLRKSRKRKGETEGEASKIPRLILEFAVENKVKAKHQAEHRTAQLVNKLKQKKSTDGKVDKKEKKASRGARQREKKRKQREEGISYLDAAKPSSKNEDREYSHTDDQHLENQRGENVKHQNKGVKPIKRRKVNKDEEQFTEIVEKYKSTIPVITPQEDAERVGKKTLERRWFE
ncbi:nucleolar protein 4 [Fistulifera solaris]|uniref:Nucleolar protein 4 n=1 Tax=Fistulifera solaris TaxID=1519565 RepID=A0A1Z5JNF7_FISSO|nr:nucleolar protein 4 [Fistulifera solaris]|eukprot:GAX15426.1 nucleolar protein 4 [Fistulifera solaris]